MADTTEKDLKTLNIDGNVYNLKDSYIREIVGGLLETINTNNQALVGRINDLNARIESLESQLSNQGLIV